MTTSLINANSSKQLGWWVGPEEFEAKTASSTKPLPKNEAKKEENKTNQTIPTELPPVSDEDAGW